MLNTRINEIKEFLKPDEAAIITSDTNRLYFTGFHSSAGTVLITKTSAVLLIDFRYFEKAKSEIKHIDVVLLQKFYSQLGDLLKNAKIKNILLETDYVNISALSSFKKNFSDFTVSIKSKLAKKITQMRSVKSQFELEQIKQAQSLTDKTFTYILSRIEKGRTERDIMLDMEFFIRKNGSEGVAFDFIVVSGKNSSLPHGVPTDKKLQNGDFITMDFGGVINGYRSDMTRTVALNHADSLQKEIYSIVLNAQSKAIEKIKPHTKCCDVDKTARDIIQNAGYGDCFGHGLGHSVGLDIHENPAFNTRDTTILKKGMVITVEPGIYIKNKFGVRIEDMVYITDDSYLNLTKSPKELIII